MKNRNCSQSKLFWILVSSILLSRTPVCCLGTSFLRKTQIQELIQNKITIKIGILGASLPESIKNNILKINPQSLKIFDESLCFSQETCHEVQNPQIKDQILNNFKQNSNSMYFPTSYLKLLFGPHNFFNFDQAPTPDDLEATAELVKLVPIHINSCDLVVQSSLKTLDGVLIFSDFFRNRKE